MPVALQDASSTNCIPHCAQRMHACFMQRVKNVCVTSEDNPRILLGACIYVSRHSYSFILFFRLLQTLV